MGILTNTSSVLYLLVKYKDQLEEVRNSTEPQPVLLCVHTVRNNYKVIVNPIIYCLLQLFKESWFYLKNNK